MFRRTETGIAEHVDVTQSVDITRSCGDNDLNQPGETRARSFGREPSRRWRDDASCRNMATRYFDPWDSDDKAPEPAATAAQLCATCPVRRACLIEAIANAEPYGTWGGLTLKQRKKLIRARKRVRCPICSGSLLALTGDNAQACLSCGITWRTVSPSRRTRSTTPEYPSTIQLPQQIDTRTS